LFGFGSQSLNVFPRQLSPVGAKSILSFGVYPSGNYLHPAWLPQQCKVQAAFGVALITVVPIFGRAWADHN